MMKFKMHALTGFTFNVWILIAASFPSPIFSQTPMDANLFRESRNLKITASKSSSKNDFDFLVGKWTIHNRKLNSRLTGSTEWMEFEASQEMRKVLTGIGNVENI